MGGKAIDRSGQKINMLTVIRRVDKPNGKKWTPYWLCKCDCGKEVIVSSSSLSGNRRKSCGCIMFGVRENLVGKKFNRWTVINLHPNKYGPVWNVRCDCGKLSTVEARSLKNGRSTRCISCAQKLRYEKAKEEILRSGLKYCKGCKDKIPISKFGKNRVHITGCDIYCLECRRKKKFKWIYKIEYEEAIRIYENQHGKCAICFENLPWEKAQMDHNHVTEKVREFLCKLCNFALGALKEDVDILKSCIEYINKHNVVN